MEVNCCELLWITVRVWLPATEVLSPRSNCEFVSVATENLVNSEVN